MPYSDPALMVGSPALLDQALPGQSPSLAADLTNALDVNDSRSTAPIAAPIAPHSLPGPRTESPADQHTMWTEATCFSYFQLGDASGDNTPHTVLAGGALRLSYQFEAQDEPVEIRLEAWQTGNWIATLGTWTTACLQEGLIDLTSIQQTGEVQFHLVAQTNTTTVVSSDAVGQILAWGQAITGTFTADTLEYGSNPEQPLGQVFLGRGGTDTLNLLGIERSHITCLNGLSLNAFDPNAGITHQAIFRGTAFDYITLADGREIYFQGIEQLCFADGTLRLSVQPNDPYFTEQWNLHTTDVDSAWRFTQGASNILIASLDGGILTPSDRPGEIADIDVDRLLADASADDNFTSSAYGHGHLSISIMAATPNNDSDIAGINWQSQVYVNDVYGGGGWEWRDGRWMHPSSVTLAVAIRQVIDYARAHQQRVVFQAGIQGESWLNNGDREEIEQLLRDSTDVAIFAVAAGNGSIDIDATDPDLESVQRNLSAGFARYQTAYGNVIAVGAARSGPMSTALGLANATQVDLAGYSNRGPSLTLVAPTDVPAVDKSGEIRFFGGTSAANPNMAGIASLVWSVNPTLTGEQLRQVLIETAMDLGEPGKDDHFGNGLVNADAAVRRAWALRQAQDLANLYPSGLLV
jgi:serine protease